MSAAHLSEPGVLLEICRSAERFHAANDADGPLDLLLEGLARMHTDGRAVAIPIFRARRAALSSSRLKMWCSGIRPRRWPATCCRIRTGPRPSSSDRPRSSEGPERSRSTVVPIVPRDRQVWTGDFAAAEALIAESDNVAAAIGDRLPPFAAIRLRCLQGREAEASALIDATVTMAEGVGAGLAVRVARGRRGPLQRSCPL